MVQPSLSRLYTLSLFVTGVLKHRVQIVEIIQGSAVTIQALSLFVTGVLKHRVQIVEIIHGSAVTIKALHSIIVCYRCPEAYSTDSRVHPWFSSDLPGSYSIIVCYRCLEV